MESGHAGIHLALVQKDPMACVKVALPRLPLASPLRDVGSPLFRRVRRFFRQGLGFWSIVLHGAAAPTGSENSSIRSFKRMSGSSFIRALIFCNISSSGLGFRPAFLGRASTLPVSRYNARTRVIAPALTRNSLDSRAWLAPSSLAAMILALGSFDNSAGFFLPSLSLSLQIYVLFH
jgi:hypothetical protein